MAKEIGNSQFFKSDFSKQTKTYGKVERSRKNWKRLARATISKEGKNHRLECVR